MLCLSRADYSVAVFSMSTSQTWKTLFYEWPTGIQRRGILVNTLNEAMPFKSYMVRGDTLLLERSNPDSLGARFILLGFDSISSVKFIDPLKESVFNAAGFEGKLSPM
jgi:hypothetical protein